MPRTVLAHLNIGVPDEDTRTVDQIEEALNGLFEVGKDDPSVSELRLEIALIEEV